MVREIETVIAGGGQAGLALSYYLTQQRRDHVVLEQSRIGEAWRSGRWDSFTLVSPNWTIVLPGLVYDGSDPDGFMPRDEFVDYLEQYVRRYELPVRCGVRVEAVEQDGEGFRVETSEGTYRAANLVIATGYFQQPHIPAMSSRISGEIVQMHSSQYRNPESLVPGAVLVVGCGQSGCQIAEELNESGRTVYLATGNAALAPRRYRGKDIFWWVDRLGIFDRTVDMLPTPRAKYGIHNPQVSGKKGGRELNLHRLAADGIILLGRVRGVEGDIVELAADLSENVAKADAEAAKLKQGIEAYIAKTGMDAPADEAEQSEWPDEWAKGEPVTALDLKAAGITTVIWAVGYRFDYSLVRLPVCDEDGYPIQRRGVTAYPGLYFLGLHFLHKAKSSLVYGISEDAAYLADVIDRRMRGDAAD